MKRREALWIAISLLLVPVAIGLALASVAESSLGSPKNPTEIVNPSSPTLKDKSQISSKKAFRPQSTSKGSEKARTKLSEGSNEDVSSKSSKESSSERCSTDPSDMYTAGYFMQIGEIYENGWRYTWYSENVLPGGGLDIPGRHLDDEGYVVDYEGRLVAASEDIPYGTEIEVPFGSGTAVVRDCGCPSGTIDIYVGW